MKIGFLPYLAEHIVEINTARVIKSDVKTGHNTS
ncbi:MAG: hypothetical protein ACI83B_002080 [Sediminicola sp.]|jgi:hypothetical protein